MAGGHTDRKRTEARGGRRAHEARLVPIGSLRPYRGNPRRGDLGAIRESLRSNGQYRPLVVRRKTSEILAGNHTWLAAAEEGYAEVWATFVDCDARTARRIVLADNRTNDLAGYDEPALAELLGSLPSLAGTGYDQPAVDELLARLLPDAERPPDEAPAPPPQPQTKPGDLYRLGDHRLLCGDATSPADAERLMAGEDAQLLWTDPPYGVGYVGKTAAGLTIAGDSAQGLAELLGAAFSVADAALRPGAALYVAHPAGALSVAFANAFLAQGWRLRQTFVWVKDQMVLGHADYNYKHEGLLYGYKAGGGRRGRGGGGWYGDNSQVSVLEAPRPKASPEHPTIKPLGLVEIGLSNSSAPGALVLDPFGGSGSTLMACELRGRRARLLEIDPRYCEVVVRRWEDHSGRRAERIAG